MTEPERPHEYPGTRWLKCDLHIHTPASRCFKDRMVTAEAWVERALEQGLDCVAVTDHNTAAWIEQIQAAADGTPLTVFPGVELTCSDAKIHVLVLFDPAKCKRHVEAFMIRAGLDCDTFGEEDAHTTMSVVDVAKLANEMGALALPAHIDEFNGLGYVSHDVRKDVITLSFVNGVQIVNEVLAEADPETLDRDAFKTALEERYQCEISSQQVKDYVNTVAQCRDHGLALLTSSDNPAEPGESKHGCWGIGQQYTWLKMTAVPTLESLRQALLLPRFRVRNCFVSPAVPYTAPELWVKGITIANTEITEGETPLAVAFSPHMSTIIGGRGTGKSTILKCIRGVLGKRKDIDHLDGVRKEQDDFFRTHDKRSKVGVLKPDTTIVLNLCKNKTEYRISGTAFNRMGEGTITMEKWDPRAGAYTPIEASEEDLVFLFPLDIYNQKQIYELAQTPNALRNIIDESIDDMEPLQYRLDALESDYLEEAAKIEALRQTIAKQSRVKIEIEDIQNQIRSFEESGYHTLLASLQQYEREKERIDSFRTQLAENERAIRELQREIALTPMDAEAFQPDRWPAVGSHARTATHEIAAVSNEVGALAQRVATITQRFDDGIEACAWHQAYTKTTRDFESAKAAIQEQGLHDLDDFEQLMGELKTKRDELRQIETATQRLDEKLRKQRERKARAIAIRREITTLRRAFLTKILDGANVTMKVKPMRDRNDLIAQFRAIVQRESGFEQDIEKFAEATRCGIDQVPFFANL